MLIGERALLSVHLPRVLFFSVKFLRKSKLIDKGLPPLPPSEWPFSYWSIGEAEDIAAGAVARGYTVL